MHAPSNLPTNQPFGDCLGVRFANHMVAYPPNIVLILEIPELNENLLLDPVFTAQDKKPADSVFPVAIFDKRVIIPQSLGVPERPFNRFCDLQLGISGDDSNTIISTSSPNIEMNRNPRLTMLGVLILNLVTKTKPPAKTGCSSPNNGAIYGKSLCSRIRKNLESFPTAFTNPVRCGHNNETTFGSNHSSDTKRDIKDIFVLNDTLTLENPRCSGIHPPMA